VAELNSFIDSVLGPSATGGYNPVNTAVLVVFGFLFLFKLVWPLLKKNNIEIGLKLVIASIPFLLAGTIVRTLEDSGVLPYSFNPLEAGFYTHTPGLWILTAVIIAASIVLLKKLFEGKKTGYQIPLFVFGAVLFFLAMVPFVPLAENFEGLGITTALIAVTSVLSILCAQTIYPKFNETKLNHLAVIGQALDASSTLVATTVYSCTEQHFASRTVVDFFPLALPVIKIAIVFLIIYYLDTQVKDKNQANYAKWLVISFGIMTGARNAFTLLAGNCV